MSTPVIFWFRRDLRLSDHRALSEAARVADGAPLVGLFVIDDHLVAPCGPTRASVVAQSLAALAGDTGAPLWIRLGDPRQVVASVARECGARVVVATRDFGPYGRVRDNDVGARLANEGVELRLVDSAYLVAPGTLYGASGARYRVFSAFHRAWRANLDGDVALALPGLTWLAGDGDPLEVIRRCARVRPRYFGDLPDGPGAHGIALGEVAARAALARFVPSADDYDERRDRPADDATSHLSVHLKVGALHPRSVLAAVGLSSPGRESFARQLAWRDFYADVMWHEPASARTSMNIDMRRLRVDDDARAEERFRAWALGQTGYPLVDAGMRHLLDEGWMHNRVRMVAASFLVKHLHIDWRWGARWFMWRLVDGDLASNQHGWQWTAGTGTDAAPYHRIFNPTRQAERFDPRGEYIARHVSELAGYPASERITPRRAGELIAPGRYRGPLVDIVAERNEALARRAELDDRSRVDS